MSMELFKSNYIRITYNKEKKRLFQRWVGFPGTKEFQEAINKTIEISTFNPVYTLVSDTRNQGIVSQQDAEYAANIMPLLIENGLKGMAFIAQNLNNTKFSIDHFNQAEQTNIVHVFDNTSDANQWLDKVMLK